MLRIQNLHVFVESKEILKGVSLSIKPGETHILMGPNGSGKSSLAYTLMGHPAYKILNPKFQIPNGSASSPSQPSRAKSRDKSKIQNPKSQIKLEGKDILELKPDERARLGLFLAFQAPVAVPGVSVSNFLRQAAMRQGKHEARDILRFSKLLKQKCKELYISQNFLKRSLNDGFSGGEKKKMEALQMMVLKPKVAIVDEIDTGLDIDALKIVARAVKKLAKNDSGILLITHYQRILKYLKPDFVHVMIDGQIVKSGGVSLAEEVEKKGYKTLKSQITNSKSQMVRQAHHPNHPEQSRGTNPKS